MIEQAAYEEVTDWNVNWAMPATLHQLLNDNSALRNHSFRVAHLSAMLAHSLGLDGSIHILRLAAEFHDVGKLFIPGGILNRRKNLTPGEYEIIKTHPLFGKPLSEIFNRDPIKDIVVAHHERPDGTGYPFGFTAEQIPIEAKILSLADAFDAMMSSRPYRKTGLTIKETVAEIRAWSGTQFDPAVVGVFLELVETVEFIRFLSCYRVGENFYFNRKNPSCSWLGSKMAIRIFPAEFVEHVKYITARDPEADVLMFSGRYGLQIREVGCVIKVPNQDYLISLNALSGGRIE